MRDRSLTSSDVFVGWSRGAFGKLRRGRNDAAYSQLFVPSGSSVARIRSPAPRSNSTSPARSSGSFTCCKVVPDRLAACRARVPSRCEGTHHEVACSVPSDDGGFEELKESFGYRSTSAGTCVVSLATWISNRSITSSFAVSRLRAAADSMRTEAS